MRAATLLALLLTTASALQLEGVVDGTTGLLFLSKFCFPASAAGKPAGAISAQAGARYNGSYLAVYDDLPDSWQMAQQADCDCSCQQTAARQLADIPAGKEGAQLQMKLPSASAPRFWFVSLLTCGKQPFVGSFSLEMTTADGGQVGVNDSGLLPLYGVFALIWTALTATVLYSYRSMVWGKRRHPLLRWLAMSLVFMLTFLLTATLYWATAASNGRGVLLFDSAAHVFLGMGNVAFMAVLLSLAAGWTLTKSTLPSRETFSLSLAALMMVYILLSVWSLSLERSSATVNAYEATPGIALSALHIAFAVWFGSRLVLSAAAEQDSSRRSWYRRFGVIYGAWFFVLPLSVVIASALPVWQRSLFIHAALLTTDVLFFAALARLLHHRSTDYYQLSSPLTRYDTLLPPEQAEAPPDGSEDDVERVMSDDY